ncbi:hypothetical protein Tco_0203473 [Tanacetum coccineum]
MRSIVVSFKRLTTHIGGNACKGVDKAHMGKGMVEHLMVLKRDSIESLQTSYAQSRLSSHSNLPNSSLTLLVLVLDFLPAQVVVPLVQFVLKNGCPHLAHLPTS